MATKTNQNFICVECEKSFSSKFNLQRHNLTIHQKIREFKCKECEKRFKQAKDLQQHDDSVHKESKKYKCVCCEKEFSRLFELTRHQRCLRHVTKFTRTMKINLRRISVSDFVFGTFDCDICGMTTNHKSEIIDHMALMHQEKMCEFCGEFVRNSLELSKHLCPGIEEEEATVVEQETVADSFEKIVAEAVEDETIFDE